MKRNKLLLASIVIVLGTLFGLSATAIANTNDYQSYEDVTKSGTADAYSNSTTSNIYSAIYGATCYVTSPGTLYFRAQYYSAGYNNVPSSWYTLSPGETADDIIITLNGYKMWRIALYGAFGRGYGHIQGR